MNSRLSRILLSITIGLAAAALWLLLLAPPAALGAPTATTRSAGPGQAPASGGLVFTATSPSDFPDINPGDGLCETGPGNGVCTLRAAIMEANAHPGPDTIVLQPATTYQLTLHAQGTSATYGQMDLIDSLGGDLDITDSVTLLGAGPASTLINGNGAVIGDRVFQITNTVVISGVTIEHGQSQSEGGGLSNSGRLTLINTAIYSNVAGGLNDWGGGIINSGALTITHSVILSNATGNKNAYGGGMRNDGSLLIMDSTFQGNSTFAGPSSPGQGGGLYTSGYTSTVINSTFSGNTGVLGGGLYIGGGYPLAILNSTIANNNATGAGGGIYALYGKTNLYNVTITGNLANSDRSGTGNGGGVVNDTGTFSFINTIIALNYHVVFPGPVELADDCYGALTSQSNNLMYAVNPGCTLTGTATLADPLLGPLQDNGGPTLTEALLPGSPAIDGGNPSGCTDNVGALITTDQRGVWRPIPGHGLCDIGAYEYPMLPYLPLLRR